MLELLRNQSRSAAGAIVYVTVGTLMVIWASLWYVYFLVPEPNPPTWQKFACVGTILSGLAIGIIGLLFGLIGRGAKGADTTVGVAPVGPVAVAPVAVGPASLSPVGAVSAPAIVSASAMPQAAVTSVPVNSAMR